MRCSYFNDFTRQATVGDDGEGGDGGGDYTDILRPDLCQAIQSFCCGLFFCSPLCRNTCESLSG